MKDLTKAGLGNQLDSKLAEVKKENVPLKVCTPLSGLLQGFSVLRNLAGHF